MSLKKIPGLHYDNKRKKYILSYNTKDTKTNEEKRNRKSFNTEEDAIEFYEQLQYKRGNNIFIKNNSIPLHELMKFLTTRKLKMQRLSAQQYGKNMKIIEKIEKAGIGKKDISEITSEELQDYFDSLIYYSNSYINKHIAPFSLAFGYAQTKGYIKINPMADTYNPKSKKEDKFIRAMELEEQQAFTDYLKSITPEEEHYKNAFLIQLYAGLRIGEVLALQAKDIDLDKKLIHVNKTLTRDENEKVIMGNTTKTVSGSRTVPIQNVILDELKEQLEIAKDNFDNQLFVASNGNYADPRGVNNILKRILIQQCNIKDITTHNLRHTFGTRCIESRYSSCCGSKTYRT